MVVVASGLTQDAAALRIGIVNIMPRAETYEPFIARPLARAASPVALAWIRLRSHPYSSSDATHIDQNYVPYEEATLAERMSSRPRTST